MYGQKKMAGCCKETSEEKVAQDRTGQEHMEKYGRGLCSRAKRKKLKKRGGEGEQQETRQTTSLDWTTTKVKNVREELKMETITKKKVLYEDEIKNQLAKRT